MKRRMTACLVALVMLAAMAGTPLAAKNAKDAQVIKLLVVDKATGKEEVKLTFPVALLQWAAECCKDEKIQLKDSCSISLKKLLDLLSKSGNSTLLEVEETDKRIKVWFE